MGCKMSWMNIIYVHFVDLLLVFIEHKSHVKHYEKSQTKQHEARHGRKNSDTHNNSPSGVWKILHIDGIGKI